MGNIFGSCLLMIIPLISHESSSGTKG